MTESAMMRKAESPAAYAPQHVEIGSLSRKGQCERRERSLAIESGAPQARARQKMSDRFQG